MMQATLRSRIRWLAVIALIVYWLIMFAGTHIPVAAEAVLNTNDKVLHFSGFFLLALLLELVLLRSRRVTIGRILLAIGIVAGYGAFDEITQTFVGRDCEFRDWLADLAGATTGALFGATAVRVWRRWWPNDALAQPTPAEISQPLAGELHELGEPKA